MSPMNEPCPEPTPIGGPADFKANENELLIRITGGARVVEWSGAVTPPEDVMIDLDRYRLKLPPDDVLLELARQVRRLEQLVERTEDAEGLSALRDFTRDFVIEPCVEFLAVIEGRGRK